MVASLRQVRASALLFRSSSKRQERQRPEFGPGPGPRGKVLDSAGRVHAEGHEGEASIAGAQLLPPAKLRLAT
eukprot:8287151-Pyramimonas_sp.AAC.1